MALIIYLVFIPVTFVSCVYYNWRTGTDTTVAELLFAIVVAAVPVANVMAFMIIMSDMFKMDDISSKVLIKGKAK
jgi:uncharacterized membrane protein